jgi:hypothetical protein
MANVTRTPAGARPARKILSTGVIETALPRWTRRRGCRCGKCARCLDNARWERIFKQKFEDPSYYAHRPLRVGSTLGSLDASPESELAEEAA